LDGKIESKQLMEAIEMAKKSCEEIYEVQKKALKDSINMEEEAWITNFSRK